MHFFFSTFFSQRVSGLVFVLVFFLLPAHLAALEVPALKGRVNDRAAILSPSAVQDLERILADFETDQSTQIAVLTIPSLEGESLEEFSMQVVEKWKLGRKELDNGALLLISKQDRKIRIEVGYGLEGKLTDLVAGRIIRNIIVPSFKAGRFDQGVRDGVVSMMQAVRGEFKAEHVKTAKGKSIDPAGGIFLLFFVFAFIKAAFRKKRVAGALVGGAISPVIGFFFFPNPGFWLLALVPVGLIGGFMAASLAGASSGRGHSGGYHGFYTGGGGGGSFGGFGGFGGGGGGFGGGGASGGW